MKLISEIISDLANDHVSLTVALNKTKILATRIGNEHLLKWTNFELKGYPNNDSAPEYRVTAGTIIGDFLNNGYQVSNYPLPLPEVGGGWDDKLREFRTLENVATLEAFLNSNDRENKDSLVSLFPEPLMRSIESMMRNANGRYFQLTQVGVKVPFHFVTQVLSAIKDKLLDFMLELEKEFGIETDLTNLKNNNAKINYIMNQTIHTTGDGNVINTGTNATVKATINITKGDKDQLAKKLQENGVQNDDIAELLTVIDTEQPGGSSFGTKVNSWIQKMLGKALDGSWQIGVGAAGSLLAEGIKAYYGG